MKSKWSSALQPKFLVLAVALLSILVMLSVIYYNRSLIFASWVPKSGSDLIKEFEGNYYMGDGLGLSCVFRINADATFTLVSATDSGYREDYEGSISVENMRFVLTPNKKVAELELCFHPTVIPINWGERKYLLPDDDDEFSKFIASNFCEEIKSGDEPRDSYLGSSYLRSSDIHSSVRGLPTKPNGQLQCPSKQ